MSNTVGATTAMIFIFIGSMIGNEINKEAGAQMGLVMGAVLGFFVPWRRWALNAYRKRQAQQAQQELDKMMSGDAPAPPPDKDTEPKP